MIYQCFFKEDNKRLLFSSGPYIGFGLEPEVNDSLTVNCPELESKDVRLQLTEYAAMLWHWRNGFNHDWIGYTSYRQLSKFKSKFNSKEEVESHLNNHEIVAWGEYVLLNRTSQNISLWAHSEICHPGINDFIKQVFDHFNMEVPSDWYTLNHGYFANYWAMSKELFNEYMEYSWPLVQHALSVIIDSDYYAKQHSYATVSKGKCIGYFMERLFILWYMSKSIKPFNPFVAHPLFHNTVVI